MRCRYICDFLEPSIPKLLRLCCKPSTLRVAEPRPLSMDFLEDSNLFQQILDHCLLFSVYPAGQAQKDHSHRVHQTITAGPSVLHHHNSQNISSQNSFVPKRIRTGRIFLHYGIHPENDDLSPSIFKFLNPSIPSCYQLIYFPNTTPLT